MNLIKEIKKTLGCSTEQLCTILGFDCRRMVDMHVADDRNMCWRTWLRCYVHLTEDSRREVFEVMYRGTGAGLIDVRKVRVNEDLLAIAVFRKLAERRKKAGQTRKEFLKANATKLTFGTLKNYESIMPTQARFSCVLEYLRCWPLTQAWELLELAIKENTK